MATERQTGSQQDAMPGAADLTGKEFYACKRTSSGLAVCSVAGEPVDGVITSGKAAGLSSSFATGNQVKAVAGAAIAAGTPVMTGTDGRFIAATATKAVFGRAASAAGAAGALFTIDVDRGYLPA